MNWTTETLAYCVWQELPHFSADDCWFLAEHILRGNRPSWLFDNGDGACRHPNFKPFTTQ